MDIWKLKIDENKGIKTVNFPDKFNLGIESSNEPINGKEYKLTKRIN